MEIKFQERIKVDEQTIFKAVTTKKGYQGWWAVVCDINCKLNQLSSVRFEKEDITEEMIFKTIEVIKNQKLVWLCISNNVFKTWEGTTLTFDIEKNGTACVLTFTQISSNINWKKHSDYPGTIAGWDVFIDSLKKYCETGIGNPWG